MEIYSKDFKNGRKTNEVRNKIPLQKIVIKLINRKKKPGNYSKYTESKIEDIFT